MAAKKKGKAKKVTKPIKTKKRKLPLVKKKLVKVVEKISSKATTTGRTSAAKPNKSNTPKGLSLAETEKVLGTKGYRLPVAPVSVAHAQSMVKQADDESHSELDVDPTTDPAYVKASEAAADALEALDRQQVGDHDRVIDSLPEG